MSGKWENSNSAQSTYYKKMLTCVIHLYVCRHTAFTICSTICSGLHAVHLLFISSALSCHPVSQNYRSWCDRLTSWWGTSGVSGKLRFEPWSCVCRLCRRNSSRPGLCSTRGAQRYCITPLSVIITLLCFIHMSEAWGKLQICYIKPSLSKHFFKGARINVLDTPGSRILYIHYRSKVWDRLDF